MSVKIYREGQDLCVKPSALRPLTRVPLTELTRWDCLYELMGARYLAFHLGDRTDYAQLPRLSPDKRDAMLAELTAQIGFGPDKALLENERSTEHWEKVWEVIKMIGRYLRLFINPMRSPKAPPKRPPQNPGA